MYLCLKKYMYVCIKNVCMYICIIYICMYVCIKKCMDVCTFD